MKTILLLAVLSAASWSSVSAQSTAPAPAERIYTFNYYNADGQYTDRKVKESELVPERDSGARQGDDTLVFTQDGKPHTWHITSLRSDSIMILSDTGIERVDFRRLHPATVAALQKQLAVTSPESAPASQREAEKITARQNAQHAANLRAAESAEQSARQAAANQAAAAARASLFAQQRQMERREEAADRFRENAYLQQQMQLQYLQQVYLMRALGIPGMPLFYPY